MKKSIIATSILLLVSVASIALTFGIGERISMINYSNKTEDFESRFLSRRIDMSSPDALRLLPAEKITGYNLAVDLDNLSIYENTVESQYAINLKNEEMLLTEADFNAMPNANITPAVITSRVQDPNSEKISLLLNTAIENGKNPAAPRVSIDLSQIVAYRYEPVVINTAVFTPDTVTGINMYIRYKRDGKARVNVDGKYTINVFKTSNSGYKGTYLHPFGGQLGTYEAVVLIKTKNGVFGYTSDFTIRGKQSPPATDTKKIATLEYSVDLVNKKVPSVETGEPTSYEAMYDWVRYMKCDTFWVLGGQTTGWDGSVKVNTPWSAATIKNIENLASSKLKGGVKLGAYVMSYFAPGGGVRKGGYEVSVGYSPETGGLIESRHISLSSKKRVDDIISLLKRYDSNPNVSYIGLDFIRTGERDGYEMVDEMVAMTGLYTPAGWNTMTKPQRMLWLARNRGNREVSMKWRWFRSQKEANIIKAIKDAGVKKPLWAFTLGWNQGQEHGQDPYMFFDAGVDYDAVMIYEANRQQQLGMLASWPQYLGGEYNVLVGNMVDNRLQDGSLRPEIEYMRRIYETEARFNRSSRIRGVFFHDLSRMLWSKNRGSGNGIREWANINASVVSRIEEKYSENPLNITVALDEKERTGKLKIVNRTANTQNNVNIKTEVSGALASIILEEDIITLAPGEIREVSFRYAYGKNRYSSLMAFRVRNSNGDENVTTMYTLLSTLKVAPPRDPAGVALKVDSKEENVEKEVQEQIKN